MNAEKLSRRLEKVAEYIIPGSTLADIGSDHAYLPCYAAKKNLIKAGIAGEVSEGPFHSAVNQVRASGLEAVITVRKGDGLEVLSPKEADCITIAGMGGTLISSILENGREKLDGVSRLILQPNIGAPNVRHWLRKNGWELMAESILEEDGKIYEILSAERGDAHKPYQVNEKASMLLGPFLMAERNEAFMKKWKHELHHMKRIHEQLDQSSKEGNAGKRHELSEQIKIVEAVLR
ncbi:tRNA (adenine(22)-N(1))-methyltransferase [Peribacillus sp. SCS-37]|uniref:tRNA (adenine(22)-N(1))-methyltransferase n=1 Tax=Paraperibacillus esterisolvens TaxID=3115296 RepID=UPI003905B51C